MSLRSVAPPAHSYVRCEYSYLHIRYTRTHVTRGRVDAACKYRVTEYWDYYPRYYNNSSGLCDNPGIYCCALSVFPCPRGSHSRVAVVNAQHPSHSVADFHVVGHLDTVSQPLGRETSLLLLWLETKLGRLSIDRLHAEHCCTSGSGCGRNRRQSVAPQHHCCGPRVDSLHPATVSPPAVPVLCVLGAVSSGSALTPLPFRYPAFNNSMKPPNQRTNERNTATRSFFRASRKELGL